MIAKTTKIAELRVPRALRTDTKARRAWIADVAEWHVAQNTLKVAVRGVGSYQTIAVYKVEEVVARVQVRGTCSFCGRQQAVKNDRVVLHGYNRPGHGWIEGDCTGSHVVCAEKSEEAPANFRTSMLAQADRMHAEWTALVDAELAAGNPFPFEVHRGTTKETRARERTLRVTVEALREHARFIAEHVAPRFGQPLKEVLV